MINTGDGRIIQLLYHALPDGGWVTTLEDITDRRRSEERIAHLAHYVPLTELPNRLMFQERLRHALEQTDRDRRWRCSTSISTDTSRSTTRSDIRLATSS